MEINIPQLISAIGTIGALIFGIVALVRNGKADNTEDTTKKAEMIVELRTIKQTVTDIKEEQRTSNELYRQLAERMVIVEQSAKSSHKRIDTLEQRLNISSHEERERQ